MVEHGPNFKDLSGKRFGKLMVIQCAGKDDKNRILWECRCDCGRRKNILANKLLQGRIKSCGCLRNQLSAQRARKHGAYGTRLYHIWSNMIQRCTNPKNISFRYYGARNVSVCEDWKKFENFKKWAEENGYSEKLTIDRIDVDKDYCPENCRWSDAFEQGNNKTNNLTVEYHGRTYTAAEAARITDSNYYKVHSRIKRGWNGKEVFEGRSN